MSEVNFKAGDRVAYTTTGRYPKDVTGTVERLEDLGKARGGGIWAHVKGDDGQTRKTRPSTLRAA
jgi:hypothetical protein